MTRTRTFQRWIAAAAMAAGLTASPARAAWLGLDDGDYSIQLSCELSLVIVCPPPVSGTLSINGGAADAMDVAFNGQDFEGDPFDGIDGTPTGTFEYSGRAAAPFSFLSLGFVTSGTVNTYGQGDRFFTYCSNVGPGVCNSGTRGQWSAQRISAPATLLLVAGALALLTLSRRPRQTSR